MTSHLIFCSCTSLLLSLHALVFSSRSSFPFQPLVPSLMALSTLPPSFQLLFISFLAPHRLFFSYQLPYGASYQNGTGSTRSLIAPWPRIFWDEDKDEETELTQMYATTP
jgi:hypothetical protein